MAISPQPREEVLWVTTTAHSLPIPVPVTATLQLTRNDMSHQAGSPMVADRWCHEAAFWAGRTVLKAPTSAPCLENRGKRWCLHFKSAQHHLTDLCGRCYLSFSIHVLLLCCLGPGEVSVSGWLRKGRIGNFPWKISMMSNMAEKLAKAQLGQRRGLGADGQDSGWVWSGAGGRGEGRVEVQDGEPWRVRMCQALC